MKSILWVVALVFPLSISASDPVDETSNRARLEKRQRQNMSVYTELLRNLASTSALLRETDPDSARRLDAAIDYLGDIEVLEQMNLIAEYLSAGGRQASVGRLSDEVITVLKEVVDILTADQWSRDLRLIKDAREKIGNIEADQEAHNKKQNVKKWSDKQNSLREQTEQVIRQLEKVSGNSPFKEAANQAIQHLKEASQHMKKSAQNARPSSSDASPEQKAKNKVHDAGDELDKKLNEQQEMTDNALEDVKKELARLIEVQKKTQAVLSQVRQDIIQAKVLTRASRKRLGAQNPLLDHQLNDIRALQKLFEDEEATAYAMAMEMVADDEMQVIKSVQKTQVNSIDLLRSQNVIDQLQDILKSLDELKPQKVDEQCPPSDQPPGPNPQPDKEPPLVPDVAQLVLAHLVQSRNLKNTIAIDEGQLELSDDVTAMLKNREQQVADLISGTLEALEGGDK